jgi:uncharacterized protein YndB with AHSA1/START domain
MLSFIIITALLGGPVNQHPPIVIERVVAGTPNEIFDLWTTSAGVSTFFAPAAVIEPRVGGAYTIIFEPELDPEGLSHGTKGARILAFERGRKLTFEWITFTSRELEGVSGPPVVPPQERNVSPLPTHVELTFDAVGADKTRVTLTHRGFPRGPKWDEAHAFFSVVWRGVMEGLAQSRERVKGAKE